MLGAVASSMSPVSGTAFFLSECRSSSWHGRSTDLAVGEQVKLQKTGCPAPKQKTAKRTQTKQTTHNLEPLRTSTVKLRPVSGTETSFLRPQRQRYQTMIKNWPRHR